MSTRQKLRVASLRFYLYDRPLHPELFDVYHDDHIVQAGYQARIWVTGCTHVITFWLDGQCISEVLADRTSTLPGRGVLLDLPLRGEKHHETRRTDGIHYMMNFQVESMNPLVYSQTHRELARQGTQRGLFVPFPMWMSNSLTPFSYIDHQATPRHLHVFAFHAFPEDLTMVKTQSIFELG